MTIPLEALNAVHVVVSHRYPDGACPDGLAASMILKDVLPDARYVFVSHNTREYEELAAEPGMLFVDITPPKARISEFRDAGAIVLDHHKDAEDLVRSFGDRGVFAHETRDPGVSGALLAFEHVWFRMINEDDEEVHRFAKLAGVRDTWQTKDPLWTEACEQAAVLLFYPIDDWLYNKYIPGPLYRRRLEQRMALGPHLIAKAEVETTALLSSAYRFVTPKGTRVTVLPSVRISDAAERIGDGADVVVGFSFHVENNAPSMRLSFRSRGDADVSVIARSLGGGGHTHAAGASVILNDFAERPPPAEWPEPQREVVRSHHPYAVIRALMEKF